MKNKTYYNEDGTEMVWNNSWAPRIAFTKDGERLIWGMNEEQYKAHLSRELRYSNMVSYDGYGRVYNAHVAA